MPDNEERAQRAQAAIDTHANLVGSTDAEDLQEKLTDLITDLMHLARRENIQFEDVLLMAEIHVGAEC